MKKLKFKLDALREEMEILNMDDLISTKGGGAAGYYGYSTWEDFVYAVDHGNVPDGTYFPDGVSGGYGVHGDYGNLSYLHLDGGYGSWNAGGMELAVAMVAMEGIAVFFRLIQVEPIFWILIVIFQNLECLIIKFLSMAGLPGRIN
ncbi:hypothetical protein H9N25_10510 [Pedobacter riviphilus]|uniref:Uncharacterized protein n=1 Tax=Pedobacter riviphilus TaxID=2766984 RepID=A0ABX6TNA8_9SPHI|nr:hypothetical protein [Pedobacter riviphilus]QNR86777.1 hypothetical protein H9N25_10510 [Pedobacter riviphilus]